MRWNSKVFAVVWTTAWLAFAAWPAAALDELDDEKQRLKACEQNLCEIILTKERRGRPLACDLAKTWGKKDIAKGANSHKINWSSGDARCTTSVKLPRRTIVAALTAPSFTLQLPQQTVDCQVEEDGKPAPVKAVLSPKLEFKDGHADKIWINLKEIEGPSMLKGLVWTTAKLEDTIGIFHKELIKEINKFVHQKCAQRYPELDPDREAKRAQRRLERRAAKASAKAAKNANEGKAKTSVEKPAAKPAGNSSKTADKADAAPPPAPPSKRAGAE